VGVVGEGGIRIWGEVGGCGESGGVGAEVSGMKRIGGGGLDLL
jgi:hypothetical protein